MKRKRRCLKRREVSFCQRTILSSWLAHRISHWQITLTNTTRNLISSIRELVSDSWPSSSRCYSSLSRKFGLSRKRSPQWLTCFSPFPANTSSLCCKISLTNRNSLECSWPLSTLTGITKRTLSWLKPLLTSLWSVIPCISTVRRLKRGFSVCQFSLSYLLGSPSLQRVSVLPIKSFPKRVRSTSSAWRSKSMSSEMKPLTGWRSTLPKRTTLSAKCSSNISNNEERLRKSMP